MLQLTENSKTKFSKTHKNTFGLLHGLPANGGTCVGATCGAGGCLDTRLGKKRKTCYVEKITQIYKSVGEVLLRNTKQLEDKTQEEMTVILRETVQAFVKKSPTDKLYFRLHWAGDFMNDNYVKAWSSVIKEFPNVRFWAYTRSFTKDINFIAPLLECANLSLYLSCDPVNVEAAKQVYNIFKDKYNNLGLAWMGNTSPDPNIFRWVKCPEITGKVKNTDEGGACSKCRLCVDRYKTRIKNIQFLIH